MYGHPSFLVLETQTVALVSKLEAPREFLAPRMKD